MKYKENKWELSGFFCCKKNENTKNEDKNKNKFEINISVSPKSNNSQTNHHLNINQITQNLNNSLINKSSDFFNNSNMPLTNKQTVKISNVSNQTPQLKYSSSMSKGKIIRKVRVQILIIRINNNKNKKKFNIFKNLKDKILFFFCGGKNCKYENYLTNKNKPNAIKGLNSNYITENIIEG